VLQELDRPLGVLLVEPAAVPELDRDRKVETRSSLEDELTRLVRRKDPFRKLDEDRTQLARRDHGVERLAELRVDGVEHLGGQVLVIDPRLLRQVAAQLFTNRLGQTCHLGRLYRN